MLRIRAFIQDQPFFVDIGLLLLVAVHAWLSVSKRMPNLWSALADSSKQDAAQGLYLGMLGPAAIVAGLAGVVVVYGLTASSPRFSNLRVSGGGALTRTWIATTLAGFEAVVLLIASVVLSISALVTIAPWFFEASLVILFHGALRLTWIFTKLIRAATADDTAEVDAARALPHASLPFTS